MFELKGKRALITGSSRGIGAGIALAFASQGAKVAVNYSKNREKALEVVDEITKTGHKPLCIQCDVSNEHDVEKMFDIIRREWGGSTSS